MGAHDSPFLRDASTDYSTSGNQFYNSTVQLDAGVRLVSAQVHNSDGGWHLCHSSCNLLDAGPLSDWLSELKTWLDNNPNEVITVLLVNADGASATALDSQFQSSGIVPYAYIPTSNTIPPASWPTLQELINANKRLMIFIASLNPSQLTSGTAYLMDEFTFLFENPYENIALTDFSCQPDRPTAVKNNIGTAISSNRMPFMNHFLYQEGLFDIQTPDIGNISTTNSPGSATGNLGLAADTCTSQWGRAPTFILVDFFDEGPSMATVDRLNGVTAPVGRKSVPAKASAATSEGGATSNDFESVVALVNQVKNGQTPTLGAWIWAAGKWSFGGINFAGGALIE